MKRALPNARRGALAGALLATSLLAGCATNPVTGESDFVLMSEQQEIRLGRQFHPKIIERFGRYEDPELQRYVERVGTRLAEHSHRPGLVYRFTVLDSQEVNAFAVPGGYIYITRGLLAYLNTEAQLAAVLGHEIGHVTARHSVRQHSAATVTNVLGAVIGAETGSAAARDLAQVVGVAVVRGYGREMELEADRLGAEYLARSGYDPEAMLRVIEVLKDQEEFAEQRAAAEGREPQTYHGLFATHPRNDTRLQEVVGAARSLAVPGEPLVNRDAFLAKLEGLVFGDSADDGIRRNDGFYHAELGFALRLPPDWVVHNRPEQVVAVVPGGKAALSLQVQDLNKRIGPREFISERLDVGDLLEGRELAPHGLEGYTGLVEPGMLSGGARVRLAVIYLDRRAFVFQGAARSDETIVPYDSAFLEAIESFHRLRPEEQPLARPLRIALLTADAGADYRRLAAESPLPNYPRAQLRLLNGDYPDGEPAAGERLKIVE